MQAGLNLYSIRGLIQTEESFLSTALKLKDMGYDYIQHSGAPFDPGMIGRVCKKSGLEAVLTHVPMDRILNDTQKLVDEHLSMGCRNIGLGAMPTDIMLDEKACKDTIARLNAVAIVMQERGCKFFYHHHHYEFVRMSGGDTVFEYMIKNAPDINFTLDTYWLQYGGANILEFIDKLKGRIDCVHLKDYRIVQNKEKPSEFTPQFAPVGSGTINFAAVTERMIKSGAKYFLVEQDDAGKYKEPLKEIEKSINYIKANL